jgi:hypothetical protein
MQESIICLTTDHKLLLITFIIQSEDGERWRKFHEQLCNTAKGMRSAEKMRQRETRNVHKILFKNLKVIWET